LDLHSHFYSYQNPYSHRHSYSDQHSYSSPHRDLYADAYPDQDTYRNQLLTFSLSQAIMAV